MDRFDSLTRSRIMASVGQRDTGAEMALRKTLHRTGLRYRLHDRSLPGSPDLVFRRFHAVVFVHGCYWHSHGCYRSTVPKSRQHFWKDKFEANRSRDRRNIASLLDGGWRVLTVWECALRGKLAQDPVTLAEAVKVWLDSPQPTAEIDGNTDLAAVLSISDSGRSEQNA
ncbi:very short patch repair endonuclease [Mesorhizobium sp. BR1-1-6]|uniref:very short patch repair endonuclease n=1 Tax=Mesorhizobium sp. BR1-1-6 TaxID=2876648 RepID=UPI001CD100AF|nr:very short patch repair endonuclease [Mesorhizobium sp. BR1-1-6]MBZ9898524.1 very short patch repair endonuclease [Mesorhizobium sp. BR1-1-6]